MECKKDYTLVTYFGKNFSIRNVYKTEYLMKKLENISNMWEDLSCTSEEYFDGVFEFSIPVDKISYIYEEIRQEQFIGNFKFEFIPVESVDMMRHSICKPWADMLEIFGSQIKEAFDECFFETLDSSYYDCGTDKVNDCWYDETEARGWGDSWQGGM